MALTSTIDNLMYPSIDITVTSPQEWRYVSEGGATIVFSYIGENPNFNSTVLRLRKITSHPTNGNTQVHTITEAQGISQTPEVNYESYLEPDDPMIEFQHTVIERLIPSQHLPRLTPAHVGRTWLQSLAELCQSERPHDRRQKDRIDIDRTKAVIATDLIGGGGLVVEIKPKWAFLPSPTHLSPATLPIKTRICRFCMHSHYRSQTTNFVSSRYCPLDLFSADEARIKSALCDLWDGWLENKGPGNNLRVFVQGLMLQSTDRTSLMEELGSENADLDLPALRERFISTIMPPLVNTPVLRILSKLQRSLDVLDIEGLSRLWALSYSQPLDGIPSASDLATEYLPPLGSTSTEPSIADWTKFLDEYLTSHTLLDHTRPQVSYLRYYLLAYLLSATFKDCSIMVRVNQGQDSDMTGATRGSSVTVIDLDPKSVQRLAKWEKLDRDISGSCIGVEAKNCVDGWEDEPVND